VKNGEEQRNLDRIQLLTQQRQQSRAEYEERRDEMIGMIAALKEAKTIVAQLKSGSFLQEADSVFAEIKEHHQSFVKSYPRQRGFHQLVSLLLETASDSGLKVDKDAV
jgi:hypothetical protein